MATKTQRSGQTRTRDQNEITDEQRDNLRDVAQSDQDAVNALLRLEIDENVEASGLDARTYALANIAVLVATRANAPSYVLHVARAVDAGATPDEIVGIMTAIAPNVGVPKVVDAAPRVAAALGVDLGLLSDEDRDQR